MQRFLWGLGFFIFGVIAIFIGRQFHHIWQILGIGLLSIGVMVAIFGYIGIFANRLYHAFNRK